MTLILGALLGFISVAFGAFAEHGLRANVTEEDFRFLMTAVRYNQVNAAVIISIGLTLLSSERLANIQPLRWSGLLFIAGTLLFSFSIYVSISLDMPSLLNITPTGGITIMAAWLLLLASGVMVAKK